MNIIEAQATCETCRFWAREDLGPSVMSMGHCHIELPPVLKMLQRGDPHTAWAYESCSLHQPKKGSTP